MKKIWTNLRIIILVVFIILAIVAINPRPWQTGATIRSVDKLSASSAAGFESPDPHSTPVLRERIIAVDGQPVHSEADFLTLTNNLPANISVAIDTNKKSYNVITKPLLNITTLPELETVNDTKEVYNATTGIFENVTSMITRNKTLVTPIGVEPLGLTVYDSPKTNIRLGLDLSGGARVLLRPTEPVDADTLNNVIDTIKQRLNVFGLSDITVQQVSDLSGNQYILVEIAGATEKDIRALVESQGKFEARISNITVMRGGSDITYVCRSPDCSGISQQAGCGQSTNGYSCQFQFSMTMTPAAAARQANVTNGLSIVTHQDGQQYLDQPLELYLDDKLVDSLLIGASLKGTPQTQIAISGPGTGATEQAAAQDALLNMKQLQTILITGSLPVKLEAVKTDAVSAELGDEFIKNSLLVGLLAFAAVTATMMVRYRKLSIAIPVIVTLASELLIILGVAALLGWNLDLAGIAGILIAIGTGVDDQIVIADEVLSGDYSADAGWRDKLKKAFFIIFTSYAVGMAAMLPLLFAGAGLVKGFALTTMIGISIGVLVTRPAFAVIMEALEHKKD